MSHPNPSTALARVVVDELARCGVALMVICPGSRSGALAIAAADHPEMSTRVIIDERSAAYHALGVARAGRRPVAVLSTSGTAPANFFPAVVEADMGCVPLVVVSGDRPAEMRGVGANQTIDQTELYGNKVRRFAQIEAPDLDTDLNATWRTAVGRLVDAAVGPTPGPVHLNVAMREPLVPVTDDGRSRGEVYPFDTPRIDTPATHPATDDSPMPDLAANRGLVVAGDGPYDREAVLEKTAMLNWPVLATVLSGMRGRDVVTSYHHLLVDGVGEDLAPDLVVSVGAIGPSTRLESLVAGASLQVRIDRWGRNLNPSRNATHVLKGDIVDLLDRVETGATPDWRDSWRRAGRERREELTSRIATFEAMTGATVAVTLNEVGWGALIVASSLPIREVDAHLTRAGPVFANRGASGIDGFVSTALGIASVIPGSVALTGDLSLLHDAGGFVGETETDLVILVVDNGGGGLFDSLPQAAHAPEYERLFVTPPRLDLSVLAELHGLAYATAIDRFSLRKVIDEALERGGLSLIRVPVDRRYDRQARAQLGD